MLGVIATITASASYALIIPVDAPDHAAWRSTHSLAIPPHEIKDEVRRRIKIFGKDGGYIIAPAHNIQDDTSVENILAFFEAAVDPFS
jgi:hypothetical protein